MPTRKQRRRQQKERRHEWEYVWVDEEGQEVEVDPQALKKEKPRADGGDVAKRRNGKAPARTQQRAGRVPPQPSWSRAVKRAALLGVFFVIVFGFVLRGKHSDPASAVLLGVVYAIAFIPLQYFIDRTVYRAYLRRQQTQTRR